MTKLERIKEILMSYRMHLGQSVTSLDDACKEIYQLLEPEIQAEERKKIGEWLVEKKTWLIDTQRELYLYRLTAEEVEALKEGKEVQGE